MMMPNPSRSMKTVTKMTTSGDTSGLSVSCVSCLLSAASRLAALLRPQICSIFSVVAPCDPGAALKIHDTHDTDRPLKSEAHVQLRRSRRALVAGGRDPQERRRQSSIRGRVREVCRVGDVEQI